MYQQQTMLLMIGLRNHRGQRRVEPWGIYWAYAPDESKQGWWVHMTPSLCI
jgi:hypothetical protein